MESGEDGGGNNRITWFSLPENPSLCLSPSGSKYGEPVGKESGAGGGNWTSEEQREGITFTGPAAGREWERERKRKGRKRKAWGPLFFSR
jgi:hypothetical protein